MKVTLLKEGVHGDKEGKGKVAHLIDPICGAVTLVQGEKNILVDSGNLGYENEIIKRLQENGLIPEQIDYVINTHRHFDHCSNNYMFRNAVRVNGVHVWNPDKSYQSYFKLEDVPVPGIRLMATPGHQPEHTSVLVKGSKTYAIAGDAIEEHKIRTAAYEDNPNKEQITESILAILKVADVIIPGHGPIIERKTIDELNQIVNSWRK